MNKTILITGANRGIGLALTKLSLSKNYNVVLTPHLGYVSSETYEKFHQGYVDAIISYINGKPINVLN